MNYSENKKFDDVKFTMGYYPQKQKKDFVKIEDLNKLIPENLRNKINLIVNKDLPKEPKTADDIIVHRLSKLKESDIQQHFYKEFNALASELKFVNKAYELEFIQNDNGDSAGGKLTQVQRIVLYKRKKAEGSRKGFCDFTMLISKPNAKDALFCEVKRIGAPSGIHITEEQLEWFLKLNKMGFNSYITNNPKFFKDVVLGEVKKFFK